MTRFSHILLLYSTYTILLKIITNNIKNLEEDVKKVIVTAKYLH